MKNVTKVVGKSNDHRLHLRAVISFRHTVQALQAVDEKMRSGLKLVILQQRVFLLRLRCDVSLLKHPFLHNQIVQCASYAVVFLKILFLRNKPFRIFSQKFCRADRNLL